MAQSWCSFNSGVQLKVGYVYDVVGNRQSRTSSLAAIPSTGLQYYDANDRFSGFGAPNYDSDGNITRLAGTQETYDFENHLVGSGGITYQYDGDATGSRRPSPG